LRAGNAGLSFVPQTDKEIAMKKLIQQSIVLAFVTALFLAAWLAAVPERVEAAPQPIRPNFIGPWSGEYASDSGTTAAASLDVTDQDRRRFAGSFVFTPPSPNVPPNPCFVLGTVSHSGEISMFGENDDFFLHAHGHVAGGVMNLEYMRFFTDGTFETGTASIGIQTGGGT
jgi:hypothetical protein